MIKKDDSKTDSNFNYKHVKTAALSVTRTTDLWKNVSAPPSASQRVSTVFLEKKYVGLYCTSILHISSFHVQ